MNETTSRLYLITPPSFNLQGFQSDLAAALDAGNVGALQLRLKEKGDDEIRRSIELLLPIAKARKVPFILNDRPDIAYEMGCDGVHLGQDDASYKEARGLIGENAIIGVTCHNSKHLAVVAADQGADYIAFGSFFPTTTKDTKFQAPIDILRWWQKLMTIPCVAIGGITAENGVELVRAGADFLAVIGAVWLHDDGPAAGVTAMNSMMLNSSLGNIASTEANC